MDWTSWPGPGKRRYFRVASHKFRPESDISISGLISLFDRQEEQNPPGIAAPTNGYRRTSSATEHDTIRAKCNATHAIPTASDHGGKGREGFDTRNLCLSFSFNEHLDKVHAVRITISYYTTPPPFSCLTVTSVFALRPAYIPLASQECTFNGAPPAYVKTSHLSRGLVVQTNGLAGHLHEFYNYVSQTDWAGGTSAYSSLEEAGSYWFNAMVPNGVLVNNAAINAKTSQFLNYVLSHQDSTGWLGPEVGTSKPRYLWGRYPFLFGAIQMTEANSTLTDPVVTAMHKFVALANTMLKAGQGVEDWTATRWEDFVIALQWLYDNHPDGQEDILIDTMKRLKWSGVPWEKVFSKQWHGVNMAEGLKALPATYRFTNNQSGARGFDYINAASLGWDLLFQYHGRPSGIFAADEYLAGLEAVRG
ncbi:hypothetical protein DXG01_008567 [Tephrocybe rancida]|nr:hypothetical protein DXG01_008567 [Tephrocybe rancida]